MNATHPKIAIVGRPNVGKSTLLNRFAGERIAIVEEKPGVTRDRKTVLIEWRGYEFDAVDTGGWILGGSALDDKVSKQAEAAMAEAHLVLFVVDTTTGVTEDDAAAAKFLRRLNQPVILVANKVDHSNREASIWEFLELGLGDPHPVSALHGLGAGDILDAIVETLPNPDDVVEEPEEVDGDPREVGIAVVGRPNVGKSTLFNRMIGEERSIVHDMPGTTRDAVDTIVETPNGPLRFIDTAGMRRRARIDEGTEYYSVVRALQAVDTADIALLVIDASEGITAQDQRLAERVDASGCPIVVVLNKWDLVDDLQRDEIDFQIGDKLHFIGESPILRISAMSGRGVHRISEALEDAISAYRTRIPTRKVNQVIRAAQQNQPAPHGARILYALQGATDPPTFTLFANREIPATYLRYLERCIKEEFDLGATPFKMRVRRRS